MKLNLGCGFKTKEGFVNVDKFANPGVNQVVDLFKVPYPFEDNSVDEFYVSHFIEHLPHELKPAPYVSHPNGLDWWNARQAELLELDGFFAFFAEIWRIGAHGAKVSIVCPNGFSFGGLQDPTHTRYIVGQTFSYLALQGKDEPGKEWDYYLPFKFDIASAIYSRQMSGPNPVDFLNNYPDIARAAVSYLINIADTLEVELVVKKDVEILTRPK